MRRKLQPEEFDETLAWLKSSPEYRELIRQRISKAQKEVMYLDKKRENGYDKLDHDKLGREVEGCG